MDRGEVSKIEQKGPKFWKKCPDCGHLWVTFLMRFPEFPGEKKKQDFTLRSLLPYGVAKMFISTLIP